VPWRIVFDFDSTFFFFASFQLGGGAAWIPRGFAYFTLKLGDPPWRTATSLKQLKGEIRFQANELLCALGRSGLPLGFLMPSPAIKRGGVQLLSPVLSELTKPRSGEDGYGGVLGPIFMEQ